MPGTLKVGGNIIASHTGVEGAGTVNIQASSLNDSQISGFRNLIINGRFTINQRGAASKIASSNAYNYDRWYYKSDGKLYQGIENNNLVAGDSLTISWSSSTATAEYLFSNDSTANNGWDGSGTFTSVTNGGTFTVPSGLTTEHLWIRFTDATDTDFSELTKVQVEYGTKATMYEHRPHGLELSLCQRYFEICHFNVYGYVQGNTYQTGTNVSWQPKRATPTATYTGTRDGGGNNYTGTNGGNINHINNSSALLNAQGASSGVSYLVGAKWEISAEL